MTQVCRGTHFTRWCISPTALLRYDGKLFSQLSVCEDAPSGTRMYFVFEDCVFLQVTEV